MAPATRRIATFLLLWIGGVVVVGALAYGVKWALRMV